MLLSMEMFWRHPSSTHRSALLNKDVFENHLADDTNKYRQNFTYRWSKTMHCIRQYTPSRIDSCWYLVIQLTLNNIPQMEDKSTGECRGTTQNIDSVLKLNSFVLWLIEFTHNHLRNIGKSFNRNNSASISTNDRSRKFWILSADSGELLLLWIIKRNEMVLCAYDSVALYVSPQRPSKLRFFFSLISFRFCELCSGSDNVEYGGGSGGRKWWRPPRFCIVSFHTQIRFQLWTMAEQLFNFCGTAVSLPPHSPSSQLSLNK